MLFATNGMEQLLVLAYQAFVEIHTLNANQNVASTQNVPNTSLVNETNAKTPVLEFVERMLPVPPKTTILSVLVTQDLPEIHSDIAQE